MEALEPHEFTPESLYYISSAKKLASALFPDMVNFIPTRVEIWKDYSTGVNGLIDFEAHFKNGTQQNRIIVNIKAIVTNQYQEFADDTANAVELQLIHQPPGIYQESLISDSNSC